MSEDIFSNAVMWQPDLSRERQASVEAHHDRFVGAATMFRKARLELGLSQVQAAARLGTTQANVSKIEKRSTAEISQLEKLAADTNYEVVVLLRRKDGTREVALTG